MRIQAFATSARLNFAIMETVILHSCCAPCSAVVLEWMLAHDIRPIVFYFNPNIFPQAEYEKRKAELTVHCQRLGVEVVDGDWDHNTWLEAVKGLENEPERGRRCSVCFSVRLRATAKLAHDRGIARFTTTLASSRWKNLDQVNAAGQEAAEHYADVQYWDKNWRKDGLQDRRNALLKFYGFYNQTWCGCEFSYRDAQKRASEIATRLAAQSNKLST